MSKQLGPATMVRLGFGIGALSLAAVLSGCGVNASQAADPDPVSGSLSVQGKAMGGQQGVSGSTIQLYTVGTTGYGSAATPLIGSTVTTDRFGSFSITGDYTCPSATAQVYITATGGNPGLAAGTNNAAIKLMAALGACGNLNSSTYITINEVSTAAAAFALGQYFTTTFGSSSTDSFGSPNTTQAKVGITNAFGTVNNLVNVTTGTAIQSAVGTTTVGGSVITMTPEYQKLYTISDILAACINSAGGTAGDGSSCGTLFADTAPSGPTTTPTDTLQAAVNLSLNPTSNTAASGSPSNSSTNIGALYALETPTSPFQANGLTTQPTDWTIGINYSAGTSTSQTLINGANDISVDSNGNIWLINYDSSVPATESLTELSPTGTPIVNPFSSGATAPVSMASTSPRNMAIDTNNNVFVTTSSGSNYIFEWNPNGSTATSLAIGNQAYGIAIDGSNDIFLSHNAGTTATSYILEEFTADTLSANNQVRYLQPSSGFIAPYMTVNSLGTPFLSNQTTNSNVVQVTGMNPGTCTTFPCTASNDPSLTATFTNVGGNGSFQTPFGLAAAANGAVWATNAGSTNVTYITNATTSTTYGTSSSFAAPRKVAVDGSNIAWVLNRSNGGVSEITTAGTVLSPTPATGNTSPIGFVHAGTAAVTGLAIDPSGNLWISNGATGATTTNTNSIEEIVGAASPAVTPISLAIKNGTVGSKP